jgi:hypothetical protein
MFNELSKINQIYENLDYINKNIKIIYFWIIFYLINEFNFCEFFHFFIKIFLFFLVKESGENEKKF